MMNKLFSLSRDFCDLVLWGKVGCRVSKQKKKCENDIRSPTFGTGTYIGGLKRLD